jgi:DNA-3-methyladenine glycosylase I
MAIMTARCEWCLGNELMVEYHDTEWGVPLHDDNKLFEFLVLDAMQAGLSWLTILRKRDNFRKAFSNFDPVKIAKYGSPKVKSLLNDAGIIRNRLKISACIDNARGFLKICGEFGSFDAYIWQFTEGKPIVNKWKNMREIPPQTPESEAMSKDLKSRGFRFVGPTICYAFMQAAGMVNDHTVECFRHRQVQKLA